MTTDPALVSNIQEALKGLRFGTVQLIVHEGKLVRIERTERIRFSSNLQEGLTGPPGSPNHSTSRADPPFPGERRIEKEFAR